MDMQFSRFVQFNTHTAAVFSCDPHQDHDGNNWVTKRERTFDRPSLELRANNLSAQGICADEERRILSIWPTT